MKTEEETDRLMVLRHLRLIYMCRYVFINSRVLTNHSYITCYCSNRWGNVWRKLTLIVQRPCIDLSHH